MFTKYAVLSGCLLLLSSCTPGDTPRDNTTIPENSSSSDEQASENSGTRETANVMYEGTVQPAGISIYQQGTHRLVLENGRFILLESDTVDLNGYVGEGVNVFGAVRPTVEEGGMIMRVERITLRGSTSQPQATATGDTTDEGTGTLLDTTPSDETGTGTTSEPTVDEPAVEVEEEKEEEDVEEVTEGEAVSSAVPTASFDAEQVALMRADDYSRERWTQEYCTSHIGFCVPVHKNWWFQSYGNTSSYLWHVEMSNEPVANLGDGVVILNLKEGPLSEKNVPDLSVRTEGEWVVGYRAWSDDAHFEISAPAGLDAPVLYMVQHITAYEE